MLAVLLQQGYLSAGIIDFETFPDGAAISDSTAITNQFPGLSFTNTTVISVGISLNEFEFPPHSGTNVAFDDGGPIIINFFEPISSFGGYFTYLEPLTLTAFDASGVQLASVPSAFSNNLACNDGPPCLGDPGASPNEFLEVNSVTSISSVTISGDPGGGSFTLDDASITSATPEPTPLSLLSAIAGALALGAKLRPTCRTNTPSA